MLLVLESSFSGIYNSGTDTLTVGVFFIILFSALLIGALQALVYLHNNRCSRSFAVTLAMLPAVVATRGEMV